VYPGKVLVSDVDWGFIVEEPSPELSFLLLLTSDMYKKPKLQHPKRVDLNSFVRLASENKILHYALTKVIEDNCLGMKSGARDLLVRLKKNEDRKLLKLQKTIEALDEILEGEEYLLLNTYKYYPYVTHDVDIVVKDLRRVKKLMRSAGFTFIAEHQYPRMPGIQYRKEDLLVADISERIAWGSISVMDNELLWEEDRKVAIGDVEVRLPSIEGELLYIIAHMNFQFYKITLFDMFLIYRWATMANWALMSMQANKYGWFGAFYDTISILNGFHRTLYDEPCPMEKVIPSVAQTQIQLPYIPSCSHVVRALMEKGLLNLVKFPSYLLDRLEKTSYGLHRAYLKVILSYGNRFWVKCGHY